MFSSINPLHTGCVCTNEHNPTNPKLIIWSGTNKLWDDIKKSNVRLQALQRISLPYGMA